jgi:hypothetical protein
MFAKVYNCSSFFKNLFDILLFYYILPVVIKPNIRRDIRYPEFPDIRQKQYPVHPYISIPLRSSAANLVYPTNKTNTGT